MKFWEITANGGDRWSAEGLLFPHPNEEIQNNFVTSYQWVDAKRTDQFFYKWSKFCHGYISSNICQLFWCLQKMPEVSAHWFSRRRLQPILHGQLPARHQSVWLVSTSAKGNCERRRPRSSRAAPVVSVRGDWRHFSLGTHHAGTVAASMRSASSCWTKKADPSRPSPREPFTLSSGMIRSGIR